MQNEWNKNQKLTENAERVGKILKTKTNINWNKNIERIRRKMKTLKKFVFIDKLNRKKMDRFEEENENEVKLAYRFKKNTKLIKEKIVKNVKYQINGKFGFPPLTPHNTSQYLISNYCRSRKEQMTNILGDYTTYLEKDINLMIHDDIFSIDDICVAGGSMKGIIKSQQYLELCKKESEENTNFSEVDYFDQNEEFNSELYPQTNLEEPLQFETLSNLDLISKNYQINSNNQYSYLREPNCTLLQKIECQKKEIENLKSKINGLKINLDCKNKECSFTLKTP